MLNGALVHISQASNGLSCGCKCPGCNATLVAKKGRSKQHHFAHAIDADCGLGVETALHIAAKQILEQEKRLFLPQVAVQVCSQRYSKVIAPEKEYLLEHVSLEKRVGSIVPDVLAYYRGKPFAIEIKVTHAVDEEKTAHFKMLGLSVIEIDLSHSPRDFNLEDITPLIVGAGKHKSWVFNAAADRKRREILSLGKYRDVHSERCPIPGRISSKMPYYRIIPFECQYCEYLLEYVDACGVICAANN